MAKLKPELRDILNRYGIDPRDKDKLWDCHGVLVLYHKAFEIIAAQESIAFGFPMVLEANGAAGSVALCVSATMGERTEWATGEASPKNCKNAYPWAMAEKRAKDRVIAKLVGLAQHVYSEDEAEEFRDAKGKRGVEDDDTPPGDRKTAGNKPGPEDIQRKLLGTLFAEWEAPAWAPQFWSRKDYSVPVPKDHADKDDWPMWLGRMVGLVNVAPNVDAAEKLSIDNDGRMALYRKVNAEGANALLRHISDRIDALLPNTMQAAE